jgi:hypothetical protein
MNKNKILKEIFINYEEIKSSNIDKYKSSNYEKKVDYENVNLIGKEFLRVDIKSPMFTEYGENLIKRGVMYKGYKENINIILTEYLQI